MITREKFATQDTTKAPAVDAEVMIEKRPMKLDGKDVQVEYVHVVFPALVQSQFIKETKPDDNGKGGGNLFLTVRPNWNANSIVSVDFRDGKPPESKKITGAGRGNALNLYLG